MPPTSPGLTDLIDLYISHSPSQSRSGQYHSSLNTWKTIHSLPSTNGTTSLSEYCIYTAVGEKLNVYATFPPAAQAGVTELVIEIYMEAGHIGSMTLTADYNHDLVWQGKVADPAEAVSARSLPRHVQSLQSKGDLGFIYIEPQGLGQMRTLLHLRSAGRYMARAFVAQANRRQTMMSKRHS